MASEWKKTQDEFYGGGAHGSLQYAPDSVYAKTISGQMAAALRLSGNERVLEIGAGAGRFSHHMASFAADYTATDASPYLLGRIKDHAHPGAKTIRVQEGDIYDLPNIFPKAH